MGGRYKAACLIASPLYPNSLAWSDENLIAVASGHIVTILLLLDYNQNVVQCSSEALIMIDQAQKLLYMNPAQLSGPRGLITISPSKPFPIGVIDRKELFSSCLLTTCLSREIRPCVRSVSWSPIGLAPNAGSLLSVCTTEGRVKLYRMPYCEFSAEWVEVCDVSELMYSYFSSVIFFEQETQALVEYTEQENQPTSELRKEPKRRRKNEDQIKTGDVHSDNLNQLVRVPNSKAKTQRKKPEESNLPLITADQYASRSGMLFSLVVAWSPIMQLTPRNRTDSTNDSPNCCSILAVGGKSGKISFWRLDKPETFSALRNENPTCAVLVGIITAHTAWVTSISWSLFASDISDSQLLLASGCSDGSVKIWLAYTEELLKSSKVNFTLFSLLKEVIPTNPVSVSVVTLELSKDSPNKMYLAVGKGSGSFDVFICDLTTSAGSINKIGSNDAHNHIVTGLAWAFDGSCLYSCSQDNSVHSWSLLDNMLSEVPIPLNPLGEKSNIDVPNVFDSCFGLAVSPGNMMIAVARSFDADSLNPMYQQRSQKAAVEFFWISGHQTETEFECELEGLSGLSERELMYWNANLLWSLNQYQAINKPLVVWDILEALASFRQCAPKYVEHILGKWLISYIGTALELPIIETLSQASDFLPKMSSRQLHLLNIVIRRVILTELNADKINLEQVELYGLEGGEEHLQLWLNLLFSSERELRERLLAFSLSTILSLTSEASGKTDSQYPRLVGIAQMEQWVALNSDHIKDDLKVLFADVKNLKRSKKLQTICEYVPKEQCSFCSALVPFESTEFGFCKNGQSHKLLRCAASMKLCPITPSWFCVCCQRRVSNLPPNALFTMPSYQLGSESSSVSFGLDLHPTPQCPLCGILLQRLQPDFLLSTSPV